LQELGEKFISKRQQFKILLILSSSTNVGLFLLPHHTTHCLCTNQRNGHKTCLFLFSPSGILSEMDSLKQNLKWYFLLTLSLTVLFIWHAVFVEERNGILTVAFLDVGQGDAILTIVTQHTT